MTGTLIQDLDMIVRLVMAIVFGGLIGLEREVHGKAAGIRTHALVSVGSALIMIVSTDLYLAYRGVTEVDPGRIAAQVVSGIGFLGAGAIIRFPTGITGLTTAASLWVVAGIGLACGAGFLKLAIVATVLVLVVLVVFAKVGQKFGWKDI
jgi:putative Mg2+ transporter-C (MgtC) family protein